MAKLTLESKVPYAPKLTFRDLLCVRRAAPGARLTKGTILARDGAWQNKRVVAYVKFLGMQSHPNWSSGPEHLLFVVGVVPLGQLYADGRAKITPKIAVQEQELYLPVPKAGEQIQCGSHLGGWYIVESIPPANRQVSTIHSAKGVHYIAKPQSGHISCHPEIGPLLPIDWKVKQAVRHHNQYGTPLPAGVAYIAPKPRPPEAILDSFIIK